MVREAEAPIAERHSYLVVGTTRTPVRTVVLAPQQGLNEECPDLWCCRIHVEGLGRPRTYQVAGVDSLQALALGLELVYEMLPWTARTLGGTLEDLSFDV